MKPSPNAAPRNPKAFARSSGSVTSAMYARADGDVAARQAIDHARREQHREALRHRKHGEADDGADEAEDQDGPSAESVGQHTEDGRRNQLCEGERREQKADDDRRGPEGLGIERQQRDDDAETDEIDEDREEDDEQRTRHVCRLCHVRLLDIASRRC